MRKAIVVGICLLIVLAVGIVSAEVSKRTTINTQRYEHYSNQ
jgi:hypothetical protein